MYQRPETDQLRGNKSGKYIRKSMFHKLNAVSQTQQPQPQPQVQVYIINKEEFKSIVQQLTSYQSCERLPDQNPPKRQKIRPAAINRTLSIPPRATAFKDDPDVSLYMRYLQSLLEEDSSESNADQFQQPFDEYQSHMLNPSYSQPQVPRHPTSLPKVIFPETLCSSLFNGLPGQTHGASSLQSARVESPQLPTSDLTFSPMTQPGVLSPNLGRS